MADAPHGVVEKVTFLVANSQDNRRESAVEVGSFELCAGDRPVAGGWFDSRMGTTDHQWVCGTCGQEKQHDCGHLGHMCSRTPLVSPVFLSDVRRWLRVTCLDCGSAMVDLDKYARVPRNARLNEAAAAVNDGAKCPQCRAPHPKITSAEHDNFTFMKEPPGSGSETRQKLFPAEILRSFERVPDWVVTRLGRPLSSHPKNLVLTVIPIPPNTIRPGVPLGYGPAGRVLPRPDHAVLLVKRNYLPADLTPPCGRDVERLIDNAQQLYFDMVMGSSTAPGAGQDPSGRRRLVVGNRGVRAILRALPRKEGRIRKHLLGKRVWSISRSTISGNPRLLIDEVGMPVAFARVVSVRETVQEFNRDRLLVYFLNGQKQYPGSSRIRKRATGAVHRVEGLRQGFELEIGDELERDVVTGDFAYFNRQPSLEQSSIGVHRVVVLEDPSQHTFQLNVSACEFYNADFDGDQMNLWIPATVQTRTEAQFVSRVANWFISSKTSGPVNGEVQDSCVGSFLLTRSTVSMDRRHAMQLFADTRQRPPSFGLDPPDKLYSGRDVVSLLFAPTPFNYANPPTWFNETFASAVQYEPSETTCRVEEGRLVSGVLDKKSVGAGAAGGVFHLIAREHGTAQALQAVFALQQVVLGFVGSRGFSVGTADMVIPAAALAEVAGVIEAVLADSQAITDRLLRGELLPPLGMTTSEYYESLQIKALRPPDAVPPCWGRSATTQTASFS